MSDCSPRASAPGACTCDSLRRTDWLGWYYPGLGLTWTQQLSRKTGLTEWTDYLPQSRKLTVRRLDDHGVPETDRDRWMITCLTG